MVNRLSVFLVGALSLASLPASASTGWDWSEEFDHWREASLQWAHDIHPDHPDTQYLKDNVDPPPDEVWCHDPPEPDEQECSEFNALLEDWTHWYLEIPLEDPLPQNLIAFPSECESLCNE